ncbi:MAG: PEGA domain-containing protein [Polyangiales bacterium]
MASSRSRRSERAFALVASLFLAIVVSSSSIARAQDDPQIAAARTEFEKGASLAKAAQWGEALAAFERSAKLRPHAVTTYNIGACQRAMGQYALARKTLQHALAQNQEAGGSELAGTLEAETRGWIAEIETSILGTLDLTVRPADASLAIDGRPLEAVSGMWVAGTLPPGPGAKIPSESFKVRLDPGAHVLTFSRKGYADALVSKSIGPATTNKVVVELDRLPATLHITANVDNAIVTVNDLDVGVAPVDLSRPAGVYHVLVRKRGYVAYDAKVDVRAGERLDLATKLREETPALTEKWWFWTAAGAVVVGATIGTYFLVHKEPEPQRPPLNGGGLGWTVQL